MVCLALTRSMATATGNGVTSLHLLEHAASIDTTGYLNYGPRPGTQKIM